MTDRRLTRREYLKRGAGAVLTAGVAAAGGYLLWDPTGDAGRAGAAQSTPLWQPTNYFADIELPPSAPRISVAVGDGQQIDRLVRAALEALDPGAGLGRFIKAGDVVLLKPNVGFDRPSQLGATTHPEVVRSMIRLCLEAGARDVLITDNPIETPQACFSRSGIARVADEEGARVVLPTAQRFETLVLRDRPVDRARGEALERWPILHAPLSAATKVIGIAPIKDHNLCSASMNLKNWYGLLGGRRNQFHQVIHEIISDLGLMISPTLVVADATRVMMRNGPTGGRITDVQPGGQLGRPAIIASADPVACDAWCYENLLGRDPAGLRYLDLAGDKIAAHRSPPDSNGSASVIGAYTIAPGSL